MNNKMSFLAHCKEIRNRLILLLFFFIISFIVSYFYINQLYNILLIPLKNLNIAELEPRRLIYTALPEAFTSYIKLALFVSLLVSFPYLNWHLYRFIMPGLYKNEKKFYLYMLIFSPILFYFGCFFAYYVIFPLAWQFFLTFENLASNFPIILEAKISEYLSLSMRIIIAFGLSFQLPIILTLLIKSGLMSYNNLKNCRKYAFLLFFIIGAVITPPDIISQIGIALPMYLLYEITLLISKKNA